MVCHRHVRIGTVSDRSRPSGVDLQVCGLWIDMAVHSYDLIMARGSHVDHWTVPDSGRFDRYGQCVTGLWSHLDRSRVYCKLFECRHVLLWSVSISDTEWRQRLLIHRFWNHLVRSYGAWNEHVSWCRSVCFRTVHDGRERQWIHFHIERFWRDVDITRQCTILA